MIKERQCPICGSPISFQVVTLDRNFYILNGEIEEDTNNQAWEFEGLVFHCSNDMEHDLHTGDLLVDEKQRKWEKHIEEELHKKYKDL